MKFKAMPPTNQPQAAPPLQSEPLQPTEAESIQAEPEDTAPLLTWQNEGAAPSGHRPTSWYITLGLIFAAAIVAAIWTKTWFFIPLGVLVPWALAVYAGRGDDAHTYALFPGGVQIDTKFFGYDLFKAYFVIEESQRVIFELVPGRRFSTLVTLQAHGEEIPVIEEILNSVLPQTEPQGYVGESIFKRLKF